MAEEKGAARAQHRVSMENRRALEITGVTDIDSFDEQTVAVFTDVGELVVRGSSLHISRIDVESGNLSLEGEIDSLEYTDNVAVRGFSAALFSVWAVFSFFSRNVRESSAGLRWQGRCWERSSIGRFWEKLWCVRERGCWVWRLVPCGWCCGFG